jgi:MoxR-like ATPase
VRARTADYADSTMCGSGTELSEWRDSALRFESALNERLLGLSRAIRLLTVAVFARGHVLLEGNVGVGKTTLLRAAARGLGGEYERVEGTIDLMPQDLVYHTHIDRDGKPRVDPGPLLTHGEALSVFFFNEINRARPQVHSLLLRVMSEGSLTAFGAARDRFLMEIEIAPEDTAGIHRRLMFEARFHDTDALIAEMPPAMLDHRSLPAVAAMIQAEVRTGAAVETFVDHLRRATHDPRIYGIALDGVDMDDLIATGASPRGMSMLVRAAKVSAWLDGASDLTPEHLRAVFHEVVAHRVFFTPIYELQRGRIGREFTSAVLRAVPAP